ncbi:hypothetical protein C8046_03735 [Serinibacter arcticus]|uniref:SsuA/THI5-like domain-containing protein n=1 Tax=Serinibacter arcticus TaxID=1655435 RepID=A0A2U1ZSG3_9MICO|nr:ABC transporter substrate-binding protein [Serinibacter arcticus]PWD49925.1 hypothetical protein C8046_03735 [Serinibacter arcticus]
MKSPARLSVLVPVLAGSLLLTACAGSSASDGGDPAPETVATINVGVAPDFFFSHLYFAVEGGFLEDQGIDATLTEFASGQEATEAVTTGQADLTGSTATTVVNLAGRDTGVQVLGSYSEGNGWYAVVGNEQAAGVTSIDDLDGVAVAAQFGNAIDMVVRTFLANHDAGVELIDYRDVKSPQLMSGLARGDYAAAAMWEPNVSTALANIEGASIVLDSDEAVPVRGYNIFGEELAGDPELRERVLTALDNTIEWMNENPDEVVALAMENSGIEDEELASSIQAKLTYSLDFTQENVDELSNAAAFFREQGLIEGTEEDVVAMYDLEGFEAWKSSAE